MGILSGNADKAVETSKAVRRSGYAEGAIAASTMPAKRLPFLDGLRALCALYVVLGHSYNFTHTQVYDYSWADRLHLVFYQGHYAVNLFLILSGYCLGLSWRDKPLQVGRFWLKRSRRLLPPYYAAMTLTALLVYVQAKVRGIDWAMPLDQLLANGLLLNELFPDLDLAFPFWSIAVEWKLSLLFPLFVWAYRWHGAIAALAVAAACSGGIFLFVHTLLPAVSITGYYPWYAVLMVLGFCASQQKLTHRQQSLAAIGALGLFVALLLLQADPLWLDLTFGLAAAGAIAAFSTRSTVPVLDASILVWMGQWSYSLYLTHYVSLKTVNWICHALHVPPWLDFTVGIYAAIGLAYPFYLLFERPFVKGVNARSRLQM